MKYELPSTELIVVEENNYLKFGEYLNDMQCDDTTNKLCLDDLEYVKKLQEENQELKQKYLNAVSDYETTMFEKEQLNSLVNSCQEEIRRLKIQLEDANEQISYLRRSIERKEERIIDLQYERIPYTNEYVDKLLNQQKEFISYLENEKDRLSRECSQIYEDSLGKTRLVNEDIFNEVNDILKKYKSIIGVLDEKSNNIST